MNIMELESLRTKEELIKYFEGFGKKITEAEIDALKRNYAQAQENGSVLTMQQLDSVAGGGGKFSLTFYKKGTRLNGETLTKDKFILDKAETTRDNLWHVLLREDPKKEYRDIGTANGRLVLYTLSFKIDPLYTEGMIVFTNKDYRLNAFQTQDKDFIEQITTSVDTSERPYLETKYDILEAIITQAYPRLAQDIVKSKISLIPPLSKREGVKISNSDATLKVLHNPLPLTYKYYDYKISKEWLLEDQQVDMATNSK